LLTLAPDLFDASQLLAKAVATLAFLPEPHIASFEVYVRSLMPSQSSPVHVFFNTFLALYGNVEAILKALDRPPQLISQITTVRRDIERSYSSLNRSSRWPLGLLDDTRQRFNEERGEKVRRAELEAENLSRELRYTQQTVANELAGWRDVHERMGRRAIRELARGMLIAERMRLAGMQRALRQLRDGVAAASEEAGEGAEPGGSLGAADIETFDFTEPETTTSGGRPQKQPATSGQIGNMLISNGSAPIDRAANGAGPAVAGEEVA
jgi:hypothetical protein